MSALGEQPGTMPEVVQRIIEVAAETGRPEREVYAQARLEWNLPTVAPWGFLRRNPYA